MKTLEEAQEQERQVLIAEAVERHGPNWEERFAPDTFGCHEALHASAMEAESLYNNLVTHPAIFANKEWFAKASAAADLIYQLYQDIGAVHLEDDDPPAPGVH